MTFKNQSIRTVVQKLSRTYGYRIELHTNLSNESISAKFNNFDLQEAISWILREYNHFEIWNDQDRVLKLFVFKGNAFDTSITDKLKFEQTTKTTIH